MADNQTFYDVDGDEQASQESDQQKSLALRKQKAVARRSKAGSATGKAIKNTGRTMEATGAGVQATGKTMKYAGKGVKMAGRGMEKGGEAMTRAGAGLSETGLGAIVGVPLAVIGAGVTGAGVASQAVGKGVEATGEATDKSGRAIRQTGKNVTNAGKRAESLSQGNSKAGNIGSFKSSKHRSRISDRLRGMMKNKQQKVKLEESQGNLATNTFRTGTDALLRQSWIHLLGSWGLTLIWIHVHLFMRFVLGPEYFCKLGREWASMSAMKMGGAGSLAGGKEAQEMIKIAGRKIGLIETMALVAIDFIVFFLILSILSFLGVIGYIWTHPWELIGVFFDIIAGWLGF